MRIIIALDDYEDIFDDFDIRSYLQRNISTDFIEELHRRFNGIECNQPKLILTLPKNNRIKKDEKIIKKRLIEFFKAKFNYYKKKVNKTKFRIFAFIFLGLLSLIFSLYVEKHSSILSDYLFIGVYFFTWEGLDTFIYGYPKINKKLRIYECISNSTIQFEDEENYD